ncbi:hypothetical protein Ciccas_005460 [Cichlidogyrus casuarinus]|uniref:Uncharacterized protein n=1 Tax=Cichlidogyrus casuarinus TaxID=1844966 RepID=A0ABD2QAW4_9PLAT
MPKRPSNSRASFTSAKISNRYNSPPRDRSPRRYRSPRGHSSNSSSPTSHKQKSDKIARRNIRSPVQSSCRPNSRPHNSASTRCIDRHSRYRSPSPYDRFAYRNSRNRSPRYIPESRRSERTRDETDEVIDEARKAVGLIPHKKDGKNSHQPMPVKAPPSPSSSYGNSFTKNSYLAKLVKPQESMAYVPGEKLFDSTDLVDKLPSGFDLFELTNSSLDRAHGSPINMEIFNADKKKPNPYIKCVFKSSSLNFASQDRSSTHGSFIN